MKKRIILGVIVGFVSFNVSAQFVAKMEVKGTIKGICNSNEVYALFPSFKGQDEAICPVSDGVILRRLNEEVQFVKDNPNYTDKGMIGIVINCQGEVVQCKMDTKTKNKELDQQIEAVFNSLGEWKAGQLDGKNVDSSKRIRFEINEGKFIFI